MTKEEKLSLINQVSFWWHSFDLGDGVVVNGWKSLGTLQHELKQMTLPDLHGKSVLDVGAWDGFFSFAAEELGAERVLALDHYVWSLNLSIHSEYYNKCKENNIVPKPYHLVPGNWNPGTLPGKIGFDTIHKIKDSSVEQLVADFMTVNPIELGMFDIVFFLGVLYHLEDPYGGLKRLSLITREMAIIETAAIYIPQCENLSLFEFYESNELNWDIGNWFAPNLMGLAKACRAAGFKRIAVTSPYPPQNIDGSQMLRCRLMIHAYKK